MIKRKAKRRSSELAELDRASREIELRIQELEASLKRPAPQTRMRLDRNTMPPPDRIREGNQNRALRARGGPRRPRHEHAPGTEGKLHAPGAAHLRHRRLLLLDHPPAGTAVNPPPMTSPAPHALHP